VAYAAVVELAEAEERDSMRFVSLTTVASRMILDTARLTRMLVAAEARVRELEELRRREGQSKP
jgi:hypothetical protein